MTARDDLDVGLAAWLRESASATRPTDPAAIDAVIGRTTQRRRLARLRSPFIGVPGRPPAVQARYAVMILIAVLALVAGVMLEAGTRPRVPAPFNPTGVFGVPNGTGVIIVGSAADGVWIGGDHALLHVDGATGTSRTIPVPVAIGNWAGIVEAAGSVWVSSYSPGQVVRMDPREGTIEARLPLAGVRGMLEAGGRPWVLARGDGNLSRIDPATNRIDLRVPDVKAAAVVDGELWGSRWGSPDALVRIDPATGRVLAEVPLERLGGSYGCFVAPGPAGRVLTWCTAPGLDTVPVASVDRSTGTVTSMTVPGNLLGGIIPRGDTAWAISGPGAHGNASLLQLAVDGTTGVRIDLPEGFDPDAPAVGSGSLWLPWEGSSAVYRFPLDALP